MNTLDCCQALQSSHPIGLVETLSLGTTAVVMCCSAKHGRTDSECCRCQPCYFPLGWSLDRRAQTDTTVPERDGLANNKYSSSSLQLLPTSFRGVGDSAYYFSEPLIGHKVISSVGYLHRVYTQHPWVRLTLNGVDP